MKTKDEMICDVSRKVVHKMIKKDSTGWPPPCIVFAYQPLRPYNQPGTHLEEAPQQAIRRKGEK